MISGKNLVKEMADLKLVLSCSEARRLISQGGVRVDGKKVLDMDKLVNAGNLIKVGKRSATVE